MDALGWDRRCLLLTNHALVLSVIAEEPTVRIREIAERVEITERAVESLLADLISVGFLSRKRVGRRNAYQVHGESRLRHPLVSERTVSGLLGAIAPGHWPATPEPAFADPDTGTDSPEETLSCGDHREQSMLRAATSSTKEGVTMKRVLVYMVVASLLAFATAALAATTGAFVLGCNYLDITADATLTVARGPELLRYVRESNFGSHAEGARLPGEGDDPPVSPAEFTAILRAHGFDPDAWLQRGSKWAIAWTSLDREAQPEAHQRLYLGPLRMRVDHIEQAALADMLGDEDC